MPSKTTIIGVAAHITAAAVGGPRHDATLPREHRRSALNGIWLCQNCAKLVDTDESLYTVAELVQWKKDAEDRARSAIAGKLKRLAADKDPWVWNPNTRTYRNPLTGDIAGPREILGIRDQFLETLAGQLDSLAVSLVEGQLGVITWRTEMIKLIKIAYISAYALAHGGHRTITDSVRVELREQVKDQLEELWEITHDFEEGLYSDQSVGLATLHIQLRARSLIDSVKQGIEWP
jgi:hypothetical protein